MKKITGIFFLLTIIGSVIYTLHASSIAGFNMSGAPEEGSCASCHIGKTNPDLESSINISVNGNQNNSTFIPDSIYEIEVVSTSQGITKFGFALNARFKGLSFLSAGTFLSAGDSGVIVSDYVTHNDKGTNAINLKKWKFKWQAPKNPTNQTITLYAAGVMANNDQNTQGDKVYLDSLVLNLIGTSTKEEVWRQKISIKQYNKDLFLEMPYSLADLKLYTLEGKEIPHFIAQLEEGRYSIQPLSQIHGIILISVQTNLGIWTGKTFY